MSLLRLQLLALLVLMTFVDPTASQSALQEFPGYDRYQAVRQASRELASRGRVRNVQWSDDGRYLTYHIDDQRYRYDLQNRTVKEYSDNEAASPTDQQRSRSGRPGRGRQRDTETSPNGKWTARSAHWNVTITNNETDEVTVATTDGWRKFRYGTASWVYGEELDQNEAMWWSPDSTILAFYEFDERDVPDHHLVTGWTDLHTKPQVEGYPKPGEPNPVPALILYNVETGEQSRIETLTEPDQYVYRVQFTKDGEELLFSRTNRRQDVLHIVAADIDTGEQRIVVTERQETWQNNRPTLHFLDDGHQFIWESERSGFAHFELRDLDGSLLYELTSGAYPTQRIIEVDEQRSELWYTACSGGHPLNAQVHRASLDGAGSTRLTSRDMNHTSVHVSPDGQWFVASYEAIDTPATTALFDRDGTEVAILAAVENDAVMNAPFVMPELFTFPATDGETVLYGALYKPSDFDPNSTYPLVIDVYGGPFSQGVRNHFSGTRAECEFGYVVAKIDNRGTVGRGKAFESANYLKLGDVDLADQVAGIRELTGRPYIDDDRVGIYGSSYGGYMAALAILKHPDVFRVAVAAASVTDWRQYDSIYTERYMRTPQENEEGYDLGSCMTYADALRGHLLLQHGLLDNNVHPSNTFALAAAIRRAGGFVDVSIYPERGHGMGMVGFIERLRYMREHLLDRSAEDVPIEDAAPVEEAAY